MSELKEVLLNLDPEDQSVWTSDGLPRIDQVTTLYGQQVSREEINAAVPGLSRGTVAQLKSEDANGGGQGGTGEGNATNPDIGSQEGGTEGDPDNDGQDNDDPEAVPEEGSIEAARERVEQCAKKIDKAREAYDEAVNSLDELILAEEREHPNENHAQTVQRFQKAQAAARQEQAQNRKRLEEALKNV